MPYLQKTEALKTEIRQRSLLCVIIFLLIYTISIYYFQSSDAATPMHGDLFTDAASMIAARNFNELGFIKLKFAELFISPPPFENYTFPLLYLHHPTFQVVILALFYRLGLSTMQARIFPLLISATGLLATYLLGKKIFHDELGSWAAMLAVAAAAPFRLLSDQFFIEPYVFAARAWAFFMIVSATYAPLSKRRKWLILSGLVAFAAISLSGWESLAAIGIFAVLFPALLGNKKLSQTWPLIRDLILALGLGIGLGGLMMMVHRVWVYGGIEPAVKDITQSFLVRASTSPVSLIKYLAVIFFRLPRFYPVHLIVMGAFFLMILRARKSTTEYRLPGHIAKLVFILIVSESAWYLFLMQHTYIHDHTISLLLLTMGFATAWVIGSFYHLTRLRKIPERFFIASLIALWTASFFNLGVAPLGGNIQIRSSNLVSLQQQVDLLTSKLDRNDVFVMEKDYDLYQSYAFYQAGYRYVDRQNADLITPTDTLLLATPFGETYTEYNQKYLLKSIVPSLAVFDPAEPPGVLNQIWATLRHRGIK